VSVLLLGIQINIIIVTVPSIFVRGLTPAMTEQKLAELFSSCGKVVRVEFAPGATYGWVTFEKQEQQEAAVAKVCCTVK